MKVTMQHLVYTDTVITGEALYDTDGYIYIRFLGYVGKTNMKVTWHPENGDLPVMKIQLKNGRETYGTRANPQSNYYITDIGTVSIGEIGTMYTAHTYMEGATAEALRSEKASELGIGGTND